VQSVPITTIVVSSKPAHGKVYSIQHYVIKFVSDLRVDGFLRVLRFLCMLYCLFDLFVTLIIYHLHCKWHIFIKGKTKNTILSEQFKNTILSEQFRSKIPYCRNSSGQKYHTVGTVQKYHTVGTVQVKNTILSEQLIKNIILSEQFRSKISYCRNS
jgi:hypothetical protein